MVVSKEMFGRADLPSLEGMASGARRNKSLEIIILKMDLNSSVQYSITVLTS